MKRFLIVANEVELELLFAAFGFSSLRAFKYVSDNLNRQQYEKTLNNETIR